MAVISIYVVLVLIGDAAAVAISGTIEHYSKSANLMIFFALFALMFWLASILAVQTIGRLSKV